MKSILLFLFLVCFTISLKAAVFTVTSNADDGLGTLREAISLANINGIVQTDYIYFNLPGNSISDVTIVLESELPKLTSNIIIDATTQPFAVLGNPNIRVSLIRGVLPYFSGLRLDNAMNIEIYGLSFSNFKSDPQGAIDEKKAGIFLLNTSNVTIGAPNKPNCFNNNYAGILSPYIIPRADNFNIKISANIIGLGENGLSIQPNEVGVDLSFLKNSTIGGATPEEGNIITSNTFKGIALGGADENILITQNIIGLDKTLLKAIFSTKAIGIYVNGQSSSPIIAKNTICAQNIGLELDYVNGSFIIANNKIGTSITGNENFGNTTGIHILNCNKGVIGGNLITDENKIAYNKTGVFIEIAYPISILKNSFYCNSVKAITFKDLPAGKTITPSKITTITSTNASGVYLPNSKIELFYTDSCPDCQGKTWFATLLTDASGKWNYDGPVTGRITSMGTNADGATGTFSKPIINNQNVVISGVVCGQNTGSIELVDIFDSSVFQWYNLNNQLVGTNRILTGVGSGTYYLKAGQLGACDVVSALFTIDASSNGINDLQKLITDTYCGAIKGSIEKITVANNLSRTWYNISGQIVSIADDLKDVAAGVYYFKAGQGNCEIVSTNYTIKNIEIIYKINVVSIIPETCGKSNGSITINNYETLKPDRFEWKDAQGNLVSTTENLQNLIAGKYILTAYGDNGCYNKVGEFTVPASQLPTIDYSNLQQLISCDGKTVSTIGIKINGTSAPYRYQWFNENSIVVSAQINLAGVPPGKYTLSLIDKNGCTVNGQVLDFTALPNSPLVIPNSITPNGDGINDDWQIKGAINYPFADFSIYNRNGSRIFYGRGYTKPFEGRFNGALLPTGVYYYVIDLKTNCNAISGSLTIIR